MVIQQHYFRSMGTRVYFAEGKTCWKCTCCFVKSRFCCRCGHKTWLDYMKADDWTALLHSIPFSLIMFGNHDVCISSHLGGEPKHRCYVLVLNKPWWSNRTIWVCPFFPPKVSVGMYLSQYVTICHNGSWPFMMGVPNFRDRSAGQLFGMRRYKQHGRKIPVTLRHCHVHSCMYLCNVM